MGTILAEGAGGVGAGRVQNAGEISRAEWV